MICSNCGSFSSQDELTQMLCGDISHSNLHAIEWQSNECRFEQHSYDPPEVIYLLTFYLRMLWHAGLFRVHDACRQPAAGTEQDSAGDGEGDRPHGGNNPPQIHDHRTPAETEHVRSGDDSAFQISRCSVRWPRCILPLHHYYWALQICAIQFLYIAKYGGL